MGNQLKIEPVSSPEQVRVVADLGAVIWREHYTPIIGKDQVEYMLEHFQSEAAIQNQLDEGMSYHLIYEQGEAAAYFAFEQREDVLFLSKIYVEGSRRGKGLGRLAMNFCLERAKALNCAHLDLTVNRHNAGSIAAYEKFGFVNMGEKIADIGQGYVMDDFWMRISL